MMMKIKSYKTLKKILFIAAISLISLNINAQMILEFDTNLSDGTTITLPLNWTVDVTVDWGDGNIESFTTTGDKDHTYTTDGIYTVSISGTLTRFGSFYDNSDKLVKVTNFGNLGLTSLYGAFKDAINLIEVPSQIPSTITDLTKLFQNAENFNFDIGSWDVSNVTDMTEMFRNASAFNQDISSWNVSKVTSMFEMFRNATDFNQDIGSWDVSEVTTMSGIFLEASAFNQNIGNWDVSKVNIMRAMFSLATSFNQDIGSWNVRNVTDISWMFEGASKFNKNIGGWNISNVTKIHCMFLNASAFNQDISNWDVSKLTDFNAMFYGASSFNQDLSNWDVSNATDLSQMFTNVKLSTAFYNNILTSWSAQTLKNNVTFHGGNSKYSLGDAADARQYIIDTYSWIITDGGISSLPAITTDSVTNIAFTSATIGSTITEDGGSSITTRGVVCDTLTGPTVSTNSFITNDGSGTGNYSSSLNSLKSGKNYYVRAYAINADGTEYGNTKQFIPQQELTLSGDFTANNKIYNGDSIASIITNNLSLENIVTGHEDVSIAKIILSFEDKNIGSGKTVSISDTQLSGSDSLKYNLSLIVSPTTTADITTKEITVSGAVASDKEYDGTTDAEITGTSLLGTIFGDDITINELVGTFSNKNVGNTIYVTPAITITGTDAGNYSLTQPTGLTADITQKELTVNGATASDKVYDGNTDADIMDAALIGVVSGDVVSINTVTGSFSDKNVGTNKNVNPTITITGADVGNYSITQPTGLTADITEKELTINGATASDKIYDGNTDAQVTGASLLGIVSGDVVSIDAQAGNFINKNVGTDKTVTTAITISGTDAGNYLLIQPTGFTADITEKELTISGSFTVLDKDYDGNTSATIENNELTLVGTIENDDIDLTNAIAEFSQSDIGENIVVNITSAELDGTDNLNYNLSLTSAPTATANILNATGIADLSINNLFIYPNPFTDYIKFDSNTDITKVILTNLSGQKLFEKNITTENIINTSNLPSGIYFLIIEFKKPEKQTFKIIKQ